MRSAGNFNSEWGYLAPAPSFFRTVRVVLVATAIGATAGAAVVVSLIDRPAGEADRAASITPHAIVTSVQVAPETAVPPVAAASVASPVNAVQPAITRPSDGLASAAPQDTPPSAPQIVTSPAAQSSPAAAVVSPPASKAAALSATAVSPQAPPKAATPANALLSDAAAAGPKTPTGMTAMTEASPSGQALHAADAPDQALLPPEPVPDEKKAKHHVASAFAATSKNKGAPTLGSVLRRIFHPPAGTSYYPNR